MFAIRFVCIQFLSLFSTLILYSKLKDSIFYFKPNIILCCTVLYLSVIDRIYKTIHFYLTSFHYHKNEQTSKLLLPQKKRSTGASAANMATIQFNARPTVTDPLFHPVLIIGQLPHLSLIAFDDVRSKIGERVLAERLQTAIKSLHPSPTDACSLYLNLATVAALPLKCSRHNTNSRAHAITKLVKAHSKNISESILVRNQLRCRRKCRKTIYGFLSLPF